MQVYAMRLHATYATSNTVVVQLLLVYGTTNVGCVLLGALLCSVLTDNSHKDAKQVHLACRFQGIWSCRAVTH